MKPFRTLFGIRLHWGEPQFRTKIRAYTGACRSTASDGPWSIQFTDHDIAKWYGVSFRLAGFFGWQRFGETTHPRETGPLPYSAEEKAK